MKFLLLLLFTLFMPSIDAQVDKDLVIEVRRGLDRLGYLAFIESNQLDDDLRSAIKRFESSSGFKESGQISPGLVFAIQDSEKLKFQFNFNRTHVQESLRTNAKDRSDIKRLTKIRNAELMIPEKAWDQCLDLIKNLQRLSQQLKVPTDVNKEQLLNLDLTLMEMMRFWELTSSYCLPLPMNEISDFNPWKIQAINHPPHTIAQPETSVFY